MGNCLFAYPDRTLGATLAGGNWALPLTNLKDSRLYAVARSVGLMLTATQFTADLGADHDVRVLAVLKHNCSLTATVRFRGYSDSGYTTLVHDTGALPVVPEQYFPAEALPWGHPAFWDGAPMQEDLDYLTRHFFHVLDTPVVARYWKVEFSDGANVYNYVQFARCIIAPAWQPPMNWSYGATFGYEDDTQVDYSLGGVAYFDVRQKRRVVTLRLDHLTVPQGLSWPAEMQRKLGISGELFFVFNPDDATVLERQRSFLCTMEQLSPLEFPYFNGTSAGFKLKEKL